MKNQYRQGDVLIERVDHDVPAGATPVADENGQVILAHGEVTGHCHAIDRSMASMFEQGDDLFLSVGPRKPDVDRPARPASLTHQEHATILLKPGVYKVSRQREYTPSEIRRVAD